MVGSNHFARSPRIETQPDKVTFLIIFLLSGSPQNHASNELSFITLLHMIHGIWPKCGLDPLFWATVMGWPTKGLPEGISKMPLMMWFIFLVKEDMGDRVKDGVLLHFSKTTIWIIFLLNADIIGSDQETNNGEDDDFPSSDGNVDDWIDI